MNEVIEKIKKISQKTDSPYPGIHFQDGKAVYTDGRILFAVECSYPEELENKTFVKDEKEASGFYPNWKSVIPKEFIHKLDIDPKEFRTAVKNIRHIKYGGYDSESPSLKIGDYYYKVSYLYMALSFFEDFELYAENGLLCFKNGDSVILTTRMLFTDEDIEERNRYYMELYGRPLGFTLKEALEYSKPKKIYFIDEEGLIVQGEKIGDMTISDINFDLIKKGKYIYSVYEGKAQAKVGVRGHLRETLSFKTEVAIADGVKKKEYDIPKNLTLSYKEKYPGKIKQCKQKIIKIYKLEDKTFYLVKKSGKYLLIYDGFLIGVYNYLSEADNIVEYYDENKEEFLKKLDEFNKTN